MSATSEDHVPLTDTDVDALVWQFLNSDYSTDHYANWPLDRRFDGFLSHRGLDRVADNGDICSILVGRAMTYMVRRGAWRAEHVALPSADSPATICSRVVATAIEAR